MKSYSDIKTLLLMFFMALCFVFSIISARQCALSTVQRLEEAQNSAVENTANTRPNIVVIGIFQLRYDRSYYVEYNIDGIAQCQNVITREAGHEFVRFLSDFGNVRWLNGESEE